MRTSDDGLVLVPVGQPTELDEEPAPPSPLGPLTLTPEKYIYLYDDVQWEEFVLEWATTLTPKYIKVMRNGGSHDHGVDIAGFVTEQGFDGEWDCYQCKHYGRSLVPSDAYPEIVKVVLGALAKHYVWPRKYRFVAPRGCGTTLASSINSPSKLRANLVQELTKERSALARELTQERLQQVLDYIARADFSIFGAVELHEIVTQHATTRWHSVRFGTPLPVRPEASSPSDSPAAHEQRYIEQLMEAYNQRHSGQEITPKNAGQHPAVGRHYMRQRVAFYSAEALRLFARDAVPEGTFESLQDEVYDGVIDTHEADQRDGLERLNKVMERARQLQLTSNRLLPVVVVRDRNGICHQLANDDRLTWCHGST